MRRTGPVVAVIAMLLVSVAARREEKARLRLVVDPAVGFTPVTAVVTGQLSGIDRLDANFCHAAVTWTRVGPGQSEDQGSKIREDPACLHGDEEVEVVTSYTKIFVLDRPGTHLIRLTIEGRDGRRITSGFTQVQVLRVQ